MAQRVVIIGGPTASGKSHLAAELARRINGEIINGDSMQAYSHLPVLTAHPPPGQDIPHHLYGILTLGARDIAREAAGNAATGSLAWWYGTACKVIQDIMARGKTPIVVGGTGLYLRALTQGVSAIPDIPEAIRQETRQLACSLGEEDFFALVSHEDPRIKESIHPHDTQRLCRALEVIRATRVSIVEHQGNPKKILELDAAYFVILPPRPDLYERINQRFIDMTGKGAVEEVRKLLLLRLPAGSPILKAIGVPELQAYLNAELNLEAAIALAQQSSRRYAKRQITWFTNQAREAEILSSHDTVDKLELMLKLR